MKTVFRILKDAKKYLIFLIFGILASAIAAVAGFYMPWAIRELTTLATEGTTDFAVHAVKIGLILLVTTVIQAIGSGASGYLNHHGALHYVDELRAKLYDKIQHMSLRFFHNSSTGDLAGRIVGDAMMSEELIAHVIPDSITNLVTFVGISIILFRINFKIAVVSLMIIPVIGIVNYWRVQKVRGLWTDAARLNGRISGVVQDNFSGMKEIQAFNRQKRETEKMSSLFHSYTKEHLNASLINEISFPLVAFLAAVGVIIVITYGGSLVGRGEATIADIVGFVMYINLLYAPIKAFAGISADAGKAVASCKRAFEIMDLVPDIQEKPGAKILGCGKGELEFRDVSFAYEEKIPVLKHVSLTVCPGQTVALVGTTGVGKSTIVSLINRFYDPQEGSIYIDGTDIRDVTLSSLRNNISMVLQDTFLFNGTIYENIIYGKEDATREQVIDAAKAANAHEFILELVNGYETIVGERGVRLSGGQKQRISIARAILRNTPILILDESTSSLDSKTEKEIQSALDKISVDRTTIVIAHRLSTIRHANQIIVLDDTGIAEIGTHNELIAMNGIYAQLHAAQAS